MIEFDGNVIHISDNISIEEMAYYLETFFPWGEEDYKIVIHGTNENTDTKG